MLFKELVKGFVLDCKARNLSQSTLQAYSPTFSELCEYLNNPEIEIITTNNLREYIEHISQRAKYSWGNHPCKNDTEEKLSTWAIHRQVRTIKTLFKWAYDEGLLSNDIGARLRKPKLPSGRIEVFTKEQVTVLLDQAKSMSFRDYCIVLLLLDSGLRKNELLELTLDDVNLLTGIVSVRHGKGDKARQIHIGNHTKKALWRYSTDFRKPQGETDRLFLTHNGLELGYDSLSSIMRRLTNRCGFKVYLHKCRHTFATNIAKTTGNAFLLAQVLGHSDLETSKGYIHLAQGDIQNLASPMDELLK